MKMSIFGMLLILVILTVGPLVYFNGGVSYFDGWFSQSAKSRLNKDVVYGPATTDKKVTVFKWKDENGVWQFGNTPPPGLAGVETMTLQPNMNIMKPIDIPEDNPQSGPSGMVRLGHDYDSGRSKDKKNKNEVGISKESLENPYAPESISELVNSAGNLQNVLDGRQQQQLDGLRR